MSELQNTSQNTAQYRNTSNSQQQQYYPLTIPQKGIWYIEKFHSGTSIAGIPATILLKMPIDFSLLEQAINLVIENNDAMRTRICMVDNEPRQYIEPYSYKTLEVKDFTGSVEGDLYTWNVMMSRTPIYEENADLFRFVLLKIDENTCGYFALLHHILSDAWSMVMTGKEIMRYYLELKEGIRNQDKKPSYLDYIDEENAYINSERYKKDAGFWDEQFETLPEQVGIKARKTNEVGTEAARRTYALPDRLCAKIREYSISSDASMFAILMSAFILYFNRVTGSEDAVIGTPVFGRYNAKTKDTMGMFVSSIPLRIGVDSEDTYSDFIKKFTAQWLGTLRRQRYHIDHILRDVRNRFGDVDRIYDIVFSYQNAKFEELEDSLQLNSRWHFSGHQNEALIINVNERDNSESIMIDYDYLTGVFHAEDIDALHDHYTRMLWNAMEGPQKQIKNIEMVSEKEKNIIQNRFNDTEMIFPDNRTMLDFFNDRMASTPDKAALLFGNEKYTYRKLNARANALALLLQSKGIGRGSIVALMLPRSFEMMVGIIGIWKAGGAYLPIAPDYPDDRVEYMLENGGVNVLLTTTAVDRKLAFNGEIIQIDENLQDSDSCPDKTITPGDVAYVIYTSGSTGRAKGVMVEHQALVNRVHWMNRKYPLSGDDVILQKTTYTFDVSVWELVWWFFADVKMAFLDPEAEKFPDKLIDAIAKFKISTLHFVPSMLNAFLSYVDTHYDPIRLSSLRKVFASGEALTPQQVNRFNASIGSVSGARLYNLYGPTEAAIDVSYYDCPIEPGQRVIPIGKPIDNIQLYIVDRYMNLQPIGVPGELCIGGVGLARGYINNPELTAEKFVPNPFTPGERLYRTGDLVRWFPKGDIEYLGRMDSQIKIRGFRIELGDIQHHLEQAPLVNEAIVACFDNPNGSKYLAAYYVSGEELRSTELYDFLSKRLPEYMIPSYFIWVEKIPLLGNGKANVSLMPKPQTAISAAPTRQIVLPRNKNEELVARLWSETLGIEELSIHDNFFKIGGDSINAIDMVCRMPTPVNVSTLYKHPVLEDFARNFNEKGDGGLLTLLAGEEEAERSYILFPYGGGGAYTYLEMAESILTKDPSCCVYSVNLPGHDYGSEEAADFLPINDEAALILKETAEKIIGKIVVYTHCVGAALGIEVVRLLNLSGAAVEALFIGGLMLPSKIGFYGWFFDPWMFIGDKQLMKFLNSLGLAADNNTTNPEETQMLMKAFRFDVRSYYRYFAKRAKGKQKNISVPVFTVLGELDRLTIRSENGRGWSAICDEPIKTAKLSGANHYFIKTHAAELAEFISQSLHISLPQPAAEE